MKTWASRDGSVLTIRPIRAEDLALERAFVEGLSPRTGYLRLLSPRKLSPEEIRQFTQIDPAREAALIAVEETAEGPREVAVARFVLDPASGDAEFAMVVADVWQGRGLGAELLSCLVESARERGVKRLAGFTLAENQPMLHLARKLGFRTARVPGDATVMEVGMELAHP